MSFRIGDWFFILHSTSHPKELMVEITTECNHCCYYCFRFSIPNFKTCYMDKELFSIVLDSADRAGVEKIVFSGWGEPTVHPSFIDMVKKVKEREKSLILNTNGLNLPYFSDELIDLGVDEVVVSLSSFKDHDGIRHLRDRRLAKGSAKPIVKALFTITKLNADELKKAFDFAKDLGLRELCFSYYIPYVGEKGNFDPLSEDILSIGLIDLFKDLSSKILGAGVRFTYPGISPRFARGCPFASNRALFIRCDGEIAPCLYFSRSWKVKVLNKERNIKEVSLGNIACDNLMDVWRDKYSEMFLRLTFNYLPSCFECPFKEGCDFTLSNQSDCWGNLPNCAHCPYLHRLSLCPL
ncbi:MAG: radical SAM protein [Synergistetes bacterium]|nr:radical SAM protein [Synergistota bacterium]